MTRTRLFVDRWMALADKQRTFQGLLDLILQEQFMDALSNDLATFIRERKPTRVDQAAEILMHTSHPVKILSQGKRITEIRDTTRARGVPIRPIA